MKHIKTVGYKKEILAKLKEEKLKGILKEADGYYYIQIDKNLIKGLFNLLDEDNVELPPYFKENCDNKISNCIGGHISCISDEEKVTGKINELGKYFNFTLGDIKSVNPKEWEDMERVWFIEVDIPDMQILRKKYGLPDTYKDSGHSFHITFACRRKK